MVQMLNDAATREDVTTMPRREESVLRTVQRLNDAASRVGVIIKPLRVAIVSHMVQRLNVNDAASREDVPMEQRREEFAKDMLLELIMLLLQSLLLLIRREIMTMLLQLPRIIVVVLPATMPILPEVLVMVDTSPEGPSMRHYPAWSMACRPIPYKWD